MAATTAGARRHASSISKHGVSVSDWQPLFEACYIPALCDCLNSVISWSQMAGCTRASVMKRLGRLARSMDACTSPCITGTPSTSPVLRCTHARSRGNSFCGRLQSDSKTPAASGRMTQCAGGRPVLGPYRILVLKVHNKTRDASKRTKTNVQSSLAGPLSKPKRQLSSLENANHVISGIAQVKRT